MASGERLGSGAEEFQPDVSLLGALQQRVAGMKRADRQVTLTFLAQAADNPKLSKEQARSILAVSRKIIGWQSAEDFLKKQGPLSDDDPLQFNLTDQEIETLLDIHKLLASPASLLSRPIEEVEKGYRSGLQNPLVLQITQLYRSSKRIFRVPRDRSDEFAEDDYREMKWSEVIMPHRSFAIEFAPPILTTVGEPMILSGLLVTRLHDIDPTYSENTIQIRAVVANSIETQQLIHADRDSKSREQTKRNAEKAFIERVQERIKDKEKDKTKQKVGFWKREIEQVNRVENQFQDKTGITIEVDLDGVIGKSTTDLMTNYVLKTLAGTCLYVANSGKQGAAGGESVKPGSRDIEVTMLQSADKKNEIKLTPAQMLENAIKRLGPDFIDPHKRREHERTLYRGTEQERKVKVKETIVVGKRKFLPKSFTFGTTTTVIKNAI